MTTPKYSITIQTYVHRFDTYFKKLLERVHNERPNIEKFIYVNGQHMEPFSEKYRRDILQYISQFPNTFVVMSPFMRGCSHMWNTSINNTSEDYIFMMSDDTIHHDGFFDHFEQMLEHNHKLGDESFRINSHWSHFCIWRKDVTDPTRVGYFDERLIGFGEEDGDWMLRFDQRFDRNMRNYSTDKLVFNADDKCLPGKNTKTWGGTKYTAFNRHFMYSVKWDHDPTRDGNPVMSLSWTGHKLRPGMETPNMYPGETWFRENQDKM
jgi:hypothetical protein